MSKIYNKGCLFDCNVGCPLHGYDLEIDGSLCGACVGINTLRGMKTSMVAGLLMAYGDEKKAKEVFDMIMKSAGEW